MRKYGSKREALSAALAWRDRLLRKLKNVPIVKSTSRRCSTGIIGVTRSCKINPSGKEYWSWLALWRENGRTRTQKFSVLKYGERGALRKAVEARRRAIHARV